MRTWWELIKAVAVLAGVTWFVSPRKRGRTPQDQAPAPE